MSGFKNRFFLFQGESVDNFNWGVRRPSLSQLEGDEMGGPDSLNEVTPIFPKRDANVGVGACAEESSDDEGGSVRRLFLFVVSFNPP